MAFPNGYANEANMFMNRLCVGLWVRIICQHRKGGGEYIFMGLSAPNPEFLFSYSRKKESKNAATAEKKLKINSLR